MFDFVIAGFQKCGTTSLYEYLRQCDSVTLPKIKEIPYFCNEELFGDQEYYDYYFDKDYLASNKKKGFAYANLIRFGDHSLPKLVKINPDIKYILILREPKKRILSAFNYTTARGWETKSSFSDAIIPSRENEFTSYAEFSNLTYIKHSLYGEQIENALKYIKRENLLILSFSEFVSKPEVATKNILKFIGAEPSDSSNVNYKIFNNAKVLRSPKLQSLLLQKNKVKSAYHFLIPKKLRLIINYHVTRKVENWNLSGEKAATTTKPQDKLDISDDLKNYEELFQNDLNKIRTFEEGFEF
jgi:hypothetical protein